MTSLPREYYTNYPGAREVNDVACQSMGQLLLESETRANFCRQLLLPQEHHFNQQTVRSAATGLSHATSADVWPHDAQLDGPVSLTVIQQQLITTHTSNTPPRQLVWILMGEYHMFKPRCERDDGSTSVKRFIETVAKNIGHSALDLMLEFNAFSISGNPGVLRENFVQSPMSEFLETFVPCNKATFDELAALPPEQRPECYKTMIHNNIRVTYADPRYHVAVAHPSPGNRSDEQKWMKHLRIGRLLVTLQTEKFLIVVQELCNELPHDLITARRLFRIQQAIRIARMQHQFSDIYYRFMMTVPKSMPGAVLALLQDIMPVATYMTSMQESQVEMLPDAYVSRVLHAFRADAWNHWGSSKNLLMLHHISLAIDSFSLFSQNYDPAARGNLVTSLMVQQMDVYVICRALRNWRPASTSDAHRFDAAPRLPCVIMLYAGDLHAENIARILPRISPVDVLYHSPMSRPVRQCQNLKKTFVCPQSALSVGTLAYYKKTDAPR